MEDTRLLYEGKNPAEEFTRKAQDRTIVDTIKNKFGIEKVKRGYNINSISDRVEFFTAHILARKIMRKFQANEVPALVVSLAVKYANRV